MSAPPVDVAGRITSYNVCYTKLLRILPGLLLAILLMLAAYYVARRKGYPAEPFPGAKRVIALFLSALPGLFLVLIIVGGVRSGIFTATESSMIAVVYALLITLLAYRSLTWPTFTKATVGAVKTTAMVLLVIGAASSFGWLLALMQVPQAMIVAMKSISDEPLVIFLLLNFILLFLGCFMDMAPLIIICTPIVITSYSIHYTKLYEDGAAQHVHRLALARHAAARAMGERDHAVDVRPRVHRSAPETVGDQPRGGRRAVHRGQHADVVARRGAPVGAEVALEGRGRGVDRGRRTARGGGQRHPRQEAEVVDVDVIAGLDRL